MEVNSSVKKTPLISSMQCFKNISHNENKLESESESVHCQECLHKRGFFLAKGATFDMTNNNQRDSNSAKCVLT